MVRVAYRHSYNLSEGSSQTWALLAQLSGAHDQLLREMVNLDRITRDPVVDVAEITTGRWRISQASLRRRSLALRIFDFLAGRLDRADLERLKTLQAADRDMMRLSARHVGIWAIGAIREDWKGYCAASRDIRRHMKSHIELEQQVLYPLLERLAGRGP